MLPRKTCWTVGTLVLLLAALPYVPGPRRFAGLEARDFKSLARLRKHRSPSPPVPYKDPITGTESKTHRGCCRGESGYPARQPRHIFYRFASYGAPRIRRHHPHSPLWRFTHHGRSHHQRCAPAFSGALRGRRSWVSVNCAALGLVRTSGNAP